MQRRLTRRQQLRRVREIRQAIARAEAEGAPDLAALQVALQEEARRLRSDTTANPHVTEDHRA